MAKFPPIKTHPFGVFDGFGAPPYLVVERRDKPDGPYRGFRAGTDELQAVFRTWEEAKEWALARMSEREMNDGIENGIALLQDADTYEEYDDGHPCEY